VADRLLAMLCAMLRSRRLFDANLRHGSPLGAQPRRAQPPENRTALDSPPEGYAPFAGRLTKWWGVHTPGSLYEFQNKGLTKFAFCK